ncbi:hypothetical protein J4413_03080 [Candidatus Woesearchaeota archaeon]|nr:hypothetical protein [Candidatus Woesearchaeota archaeon]
MVYFNYPINHIDVNDAYFRIIEDYGKTPEADWFARAIKREDGVCNVYPVYFEVKTRKFINRRKALNILEHQLRRLEERI